MKKFSSGFVTLCASTLFFLGGVGFPYSHAGTTSLRYRGWEGALRAANDAIEIVVIPQTGRLLHLSAPGKENFLNVNDSLAGQLPPVEEGDWLNYGGDWMWAVHQDRWEQMGGTRWPPLRVLDRAPWSSEVEVDEQGTTHIRLRRDLGSPVYASVERHFELPAGDRAELTVHQSVRRIQASEIPVILWQVSQVSDASMAILSARPEDFDGQGYHRIDFDVPDQESLRWCEEALIYTPRPGTEHKLGTKGYWIAARKQDQTLLIWAEGGQGAGEQPDRGSTVVLYANAGLGYVEIETQSEEVELAPGEKLENKVVYRLLTVGEEEEACAVSQTLNALPPPRDVVSFSPAHPHPGDVLEVRVRNPEAGGVLHWGVNSPEGQWEIPHPVYWPEGTRMAENGKAVETPLPEAVDGISVLKVGPFDQPEQGVESFHAVVRWGRRWESREGRNYNVELHPHPEAAEILWNIEEEGLTAGKLRLKVGSAPAADEIRLYLDQREVSRSQGAELQIDFDAGDWSFGPHELQARSMRQGHLSTGRKIIWKIPALESHPPLPDETPYGVSWTEEGGCRVYVKVPRARFMELEWKTESGDPQRKLMRKTTDRHWFAELPFRQGERFYYRYRLNGEQEFADPWSRDVHWENPEGKPSHLPEHAWTMVGFLPESPGEWEPPHPSAWVIYELHIPDMAPPGSFQGLIGHLDYIQGLGVNAIEPLPVTAFPGEESWGYNPAFHMAIERSYGSPDDFAELIRETRKRGIAYVADLVLNHIDANAPLNRMPGEAEENPFTMPFAQFNWGFPKLDQQSPSLKRYIQDTLEHWVTYWRVDGFRYDATQWVKWSGYNNWGASWMSYVVNRADRDVIQIAENLPSEPDMIKGTELDGEWDGHFRWRMRKVLSEARIEEPEKMREILDPRNHAYQNGFQRVPYIESHDEERFVRELLQKGYSTGEAFARHHAGAAVTLTVPGMPMLYAGQEWGEMTPKVVGTNPLQWQLREQPARAELLEKFRELIHLRVSHRALHTDRIDILHLDAETGTIVYLRPGVPESVLVALNVSREGRLLSLEVDGEVLEELHQPAVAVDLRKLTLRPGQARIFRIGHAQEIR